MGYSGRQQLLTVFHEIMRSRYSSHKYFIFYWKSDYSCPPHYYILYYFILFYFSQRVSLSSARQEIFEKIKYEVLYILCLYMALFDFRFLWLRLFLWNCLLSFPIPHSTTLYCVSLLYQIMIVIRFIILFLCISFINFYRLHLCVYTLFYRFLLS